MQLRSLGQISETINVVVANTKILVHTLNLLTLEYYAAKRREFVR